MIIFIACVSLLFGVCIGIYWSHLQSKINITAVTTRLADTTKQLERLQETLQDLNHQHLELCQVHATIQTENVHLRDQLKHQQQDLEKSQQQLTIQFKNLAQDLLEEKSKKFTDQNREQLNQILQPLGERIKTFEQQVIQHNKDHLERNTSLRTEVHKLTELNTQITKEATNLANAIKGNRKTQGNWGELILERVLERSGLQKDREYHIQTSLQNEDGKRYQPDVLINLPDSRHIIIDSKVSLINYERFFNTDDEIDRALELKQHIASLRNHIKELSAKNYHDLLGIHGLDFVLMFIPIEPAFSLAVQHDLSLFQDAYDRNIILVSPATLLATLRTISNIWKHEYQNRNTLEIAQQSGALYDKFVGFIEDLNSIGRQLEQTQRTYNDASKKLYTGRGNLVNRAEQVKSLGAKTSKSIGDKFLQQAIEENS